MSLQSVFILALTLTGVQCLSDCGRHGRHLLQHQCVLTPDTYEGPFFIMGTLIRKDLREYRPGIPFTLNIILTDADTCQPLKDYWVSLWMCDALGYYSGYTKIEPNIEFTNSTEHIPASDNSTFLRGVQKTDSGGMVQFLTVLPGWYHGRTRHVHFKIFSPIRKDIFTGQLYFPEYLNDEVHKVFPYYAQQRTANQKDEAFAEDNGEMTTIFDFKRVNKKRIADGVIGHVIIGLQPSKPRKAKF